MEVVAEAVRSPPQIKRGNVTWCWNELWEGYTQCPTENPTQSISTGEKNGIFIHIKKCLKDQVEFHLCSRIFLA